MNKASKIVLQGAALLDEKSCNVRSCSLKHGSDRPVPGDWRRIIKAKGDKLDLSQSYNCVLGTLFKGEGSRELYSDGPYGVGLTALGIESGMEYGFDAPMGVTYDELKKAWLDYVGFESPVQFSVGDKLYGRYYSKSLLKLETSVNVGGVTYFVTSGGRLEDGIPVWDDSSPSLYTAEELDKSWIKKAPFTAEQGDIIFSSSSGKMWYVGNDNRAWVLRNGIPSIYVGLEELVRKHSDLEHQQTASGDVLTEYEKN